MSLQVIGAGFGRTGTNSMRLALNLLGAGPCHHMYEVIENDEQKRLWRALAKGGEPDWSQLLAGYRSAVDWPSAFYWRELCRDFPEAKVLLTTRSVESWLKSMEKTIFRLLKEEPDPDSVGQILIAERTFGGRLDDPDHAAEVYRRHIAEVQATIPADRLLVYEIGDGWEPLCAFLNVQIPDADFPSSNSAREFNSTFQSPSDP